MHATNIAPAPKQEKNTTSKRTQNGGEWKSTNLTFSTTLINSDLDIQPTNCYELTQHPTKPTHTTLHKPGGTTICTVEYIRLDKLHDIYNNIPTNPTFEESLAKHIHIQDKQHHPAKP
jgi:hypothetical protein